MVGLGQKFRRTANTGATADPAAAQDDGSLRYLTRPTWESRLGGVVAIAEVRERVFVRDG